MLRNLVFREKTTHFSTWSTINTNREVLSSCSQTRNLVFFLSSSKFWCVTNAPYELAATRYPLLSIFCPQTRPKSRDWVISHHWIALISSAIPKKELSGWNQI